MQIIRESLNTIETMEGQLAKHNGFNFGNYIQLYDKIDTMVNLWKGNVEKHEQSLGEFQYILEFKQSEMRTISKKLDYVTDFMNYAKKKEEKLKAKRSKLLNEQSKFDGWENPLLTNNFSSDQIRKLV